MISSRKLQIDMVFTAVEAIWSQGRKVKAILFLCTGNYYRSRFAEELFNFRAPALCPGWVAGSRGIAVDLGSANVGPIARQTVEGLGGKGGGFRS